MSVKCTLGVGAKGVLGGGVGVLGGSIDGVTGASGSAGIFGAAGVKRCCEVLVGFTGAVVSVFIAVVLVWGLEVFVYEGSGGKWKLASKLTSGVGGLVLSVLDEELGFLGIGGVEVVVVVVVLGAAFNCGDE